MHKRILLFILLMGPFTLPLMGSSSGFCQASSAEEVMPVALQGSVVVGTRGKSLVLWKKKCERCGYVEGGVTTSNISRGSTYHSSFMCPKCKHFQKIAIQR